MPGLDHVTITPADFVRSLAFYDAVLGAAGLVRLTDLADEEEDHPPTEAAAWGVDGAAPLIWLVPGPTATTGVHVAVWVETRSQVESVHRVALESGGTAHSAPRRWTVYRRGEFNAIVRDPDGNLVEAVAAE